MGQESIVTSRKQSWIRRTPWILFGILGIPSIGCSSANQGYPDVLATSFIDKPGKCHQCGQELPSVANENVLDVSSARFIVCGPECREQMGKWHQEQIGAAGTQR